MNGKPHQLFNFQHLSHVHQILVRMEPDASKTHWAVHDASKWFLNLPHLSHEISFFNYIYTDGTAHNTLQLISNSVNLQAVWFHITLLYGSFLFLYPLIFLKILLLFFKNFGIFIRVGKKGFFGPWSRVMVCCSKPSFCQNDPRFFEKYLYNSKLLKQLYSF